MFGPHTSRTRDGRFMRSHFLLPACCALCTGLLVTLTGCSDPEPIISYSVPTKMPAEFEARKQRMLATMTAHAGKTWFFKVTGPEESIDVIDDDFRQFVQDTTFKENGEPDLSQLPAGWKRSEGKRMRFASLQVETENKQLDISVSSLHLPEDWDAWVTMNVNRWRDQLSLPDSNEKWAGAKEFDVASADGPSVFMDITGDPDDSKSMVPPFAGGMPPMGMPDMGQQPPAMQPPAEKRVDYTVPDGWRDDGARGMRLASLSAGPKDAAAVVTVIPAGGDIRSNVDRWLGQAREEDKVATELVDKAMEAVEELSVSGNDGQRFLLTGDDPAKGKAIDATIVPMANGGSMFIKMTGPAKTVADQHDAMTKFLQSLKF